MKRLLLLGGGHAHLAVLRDLARRPLGRRAEVVLLSPSERHHYSGMVPGFLRRRYAERELAFDLAGLCRAAGVRFRVEAADRVDGPARVVETPTGRLEFDLASLDVGADPAGLDDVPGAGEHAQAARPIARVLALDRALVDTPPAAAACVVGGGAAGIEVALAVHARLLGANHPRRPGPSVALVERAPTLIPGDPSGARIAGRVLAERGIAVHVGAAVTRVDADSVTLTTGERIASALTVWLAGAAPGAVLRRSALARDSHGYVLVDAALRVVDGAPVWGAGDCVTLSDHPDTPKAGVYAVRAGPVLAHNLRAAIDGGTSRQFRPRRQVLSLLDTADGRAVLRWRGLATYGRWEWWLKTWIDRRFVAGYRVR